ncbi:MAG: hypothetical protein FWC51_04935 [Proteobacteria bacterium]|nr:hypothetical protein [Pseudomonadota bacterium]
MKKLFANLVCAFVPGKAARRRLRYALTGGFKKEAENNNILTIVDERGARHEFPITGRLMWDRRYKKISTGFDLNINATPGAKNNLISIELPTHGTINVNFFRGGCGNKISIGKNCRITYHLSIHHSGNNNDLRVGNNLHAESMTVSSMGNKIAIGNDVLVANAELLCDGHAVTDAQTGECVNLPDGKRLTVGDHVWLGRDAILTANAKIPNNCIVPARAVVTKEFAEENCLIAGNPATVRKRGINWDMRCPGDYAKEFKNRG